MGRAVAQGDETTSGSTQSAAGDYRRSGGKLNRFNGHF